MSGTASEIMVGPVALYIGTAGSEPVTSLGYTSEDGAAFNPSTSLNDVKVGEKLAPVKKFINDQNPTFTASLLQPTLARLENFLHGGTLASSVLSVDPEGTAAKECSFKMVGLAPDGSQRVWKALYCTPMITGDMPHNIRSVVSVPVSFMPLGKGTNLYTISDGETNTVTLSTGEFAFVSGQTYYKVGGEGGAADTLTDISGSPAGATVALQIQSADEPITVQHGAGVIELDGDADFVLTDVNDVIWLQDVSGTWTEVGRFNARSDI